MSLISDKITSAILQRRLSVSDKASGIPGDNGKLREEFGNSADIIRMMADDPAVKGEDGSVIPDGGEIEISEE